ncbi:MAG: DUF368 domain-containing protein [Paraclostridium sp.]|uniref:DUF368 domain-containing protein n=1 Tax=Paraclostridium sp. TaxID=2023273 RepID=UPI003F375903
MKFLVNILKGMVIGISNIIPGVSGGTMAVVLGIYDKLIGAINGFFKDIKKNIVFLGSIGLGAILGIVLFSKLLTYLLDKNNGFMEATHFFFIGLIIGSLPIIYKKATEKKVEKKNYIFFIIAFIIVFIMSIMGDSESSQTVIREFSLAAGIKLGIAGFVAAAAMILPGVSGSFILLLMGIYSTVVTAVSEMNIVLLIPVAIGVILGILTMTKLIEALFKRYPQTAYFTILGLIVGSIVAIYPGGFGSNMLISIISGIVGFAIAFMLGKKEA